MEMDHNGIIRSYVISVMETNTGRQILITSHFQNQRIDSIFPYNNYSCEVAAVTINTGPYSRPVVITTAQAGVYIKYFIFQRYYETHSLVLIKDTNTFKNLIEK